MNTITLDRLDTNQTAVIKRIGGKGQIRRRIMDMGITSGIDIKKVKASPLGDPVEFEVRGYSLSLRKEEAQLIEVSIN